MRTIKKAQDGATTPPKKTWQQMTAGEKGNKKKELVERGGIQLFNTYKDSIGKQAMGRIQGEFEKGAKSMGMTPEQYSKHLDRQKKKPDVNQGDGGFKEKRYNPVCGKGGCKKNGGSIKKAQVGHVIISVAKTLQQKEMKLATIAITKSRIGDDGVVFENCKFDNGTLEIDTESSVTFLGLEEQTEERKLLMIYTHLF